MLGLVPNLLLKLVETKGGPEAVAKVKLSAGVSPDQKYPFSSFCSDEEWQRLFSSTCDVLEISGEEAEDVYADFFLGDALKRWPKWFEMSTTAREFLERQPSIHNSFCTGLKDPVLRKGVTDKFRIEECADELIMHYNSPNHHCGLYKSLVRWITDYYGECVTISEPCCAKRGDDHCEIHVRWETNGRNP